MLNCPTLQCNSTCCEAIWSTQKDSKSSINSYWINEKTCPSHQNWIYLSFSLLHPNCKNCCQFCFLNIFWFLFLFSNIISMESFEALLYPKFQSLSIWMHRVDKSELSANLLLISLSYFLCHFGTMSELLKGHTRSTVVYSNKIGPPTSQILPKFSPLQKS